MPAPSAVRVRRFPTPEESAGSVAVPASVVDDTKPLLSPPHSNKRLPFGHHSTVEFPPPSGGCVGPVADHNGPNRITISGICAVQERDREDGNRDWTGLRYLRNRAVAMRGVTRWNSICP